MPDKLTTMYEDWLKSQPADATEFQTFQAGFTAAAVSMRKRAMACCSSVDTQGMPKESAINKITNAIGSLADIPTE